MRLKSGRARVAAIAALGLLAAAVAAVGQSPAKQHNSASLNARLSMAIDATVSVGPATVAHPIPGEFLGVSMEYWALANYAGNNPRMVDPVLVQLIRNLTQRRGTVIRVGGVTTDRTWWPVHGVPRSPGAFYTLPERQLKVARALAQATRARLIMGVQFEADSRAEAAAESHAMLSAIGRRRIAGFELGNEPELYPFFPFYRSAGVAHTGRPMSWNPQSFIHDYKSIASAMGSVPLAGPAIGDPKWMAQLGPFLDGVRGVSMATLHHYPLGCPASPAAPNYPTIAHLLADPVATGSADPFVPFVATAHAHGVKVRYDEMNTVACGNGRGVANTFAAALWSVAALFEAASIGVDGVNIHTYPGSADQLFKITHGRSGSRASVAPEYYGLLLFSQAAPAGSRLLQTSQSGDTSMLRTWATQERNGRTRVTLINDDAGHAKTVAVQLGGAKATLERLSAPSVRAPGGVKLGGWSYGRQTSTGKATGPFRTTKLSSSAGTFVVRLPAGSAALLTVR